MSLKKKIKKNAPKLTQNTNATQLFLLLLINTTFALLTNYVSLHQTFSDKLHISPFKVFYLVTICIVIITSWFSLKLKHPKNGLHRSNQITTAVMILVFMAIFLLANWDVFLYTQPDRFRTYTSWQTYVLDLILVLYILKINKQFHLKILKFLNILMIFWLSQFLIQNIYHPYNANSLNLSIVFHPIVQAQLGNGIQSNIRGQYGMYGEAMAPIIKIIKFLGISNDTLLIGSILLSVIFFISYASVLIFLNRYVHNKTLANLLFIGITYVHLFAVTTWPSELYLQYYPIRLLFPMTSLLLIKPLMDSEFNWKKYLIFAYLTIGLFWNLDVGIFTLFAYSVLFILVSKSKNTKTALVNFVKLSSCIVASTILINFVHYLVYRQTINLDLFLQSQKLFLSGQIPPLNGVWLIVFLTYTSSTIISVRSLRTKWNIESAILLYLSLLGFGLLFYFINNPHPAVLGNCYWPVFLLIPILLQEQKILHVNYSIGKSISLKNIKFVTILLILLFPSAAGIVNLKNSQILKDQVTILDLFNAESNSNKALWATSQEGENPKKSVRYITVGDRNINPNLKPTWMIKNEVVKSYFGQTKVIRNDIMVLSMWDYLLYDSVNAKSPLIAPNFYHTYLDYEWDQIYSFLGSESTSINYVVLDDQFGLFQGELLAHPTEKITQIKKLLEKNYMLVLDKYVGDTWYNGQWEANYLKIFKRFE